MEGVGVVKFVMNAEKFLFLAEYLADQRRGNLFPRMSLSGDNKREQGILDITVINSSQEFLAHPNCPIALKCYSGYAKSIVDVALSATANVSSSNTNLLNLCGLSGKAASKILLRDAPVYMEKLVAALVTIKAKQDAPYVEGDLMTLSDRRMDKAGRVEIISQKTDYGCEILGRSTKRGRGAFENEYEYDDDEFADNEEERYHHGDESNNNDAFGNAVSNDDEEGILPPSFRSYSSNFELPPPNQLIQKPNKGGNKASTTRVGTSFNEGQGSRPPTSSQRELADVNAQLSKLVNLLGSETSSSTPVAVPLTFDQQMQLKQMDLDIAKARNENRL